jgi:hypothetical protein
MHTGVRARLNPVWVAYEQPQAAVPVTDWRLWPSSPPYTTSAGAQAPYTLATQFAVSQPCTLARIWWYSYSGATVLPQICGIWDIATQALVAEDAAPSWQLPAGGDAAAGAGWVSCDFTAAAVTLQPGLNYCTSVYQPASAAWWDTAAGYWTSGSGLGGANGITSGILTAPNTGSSVNGQGCFAAGQWQFPGTDPGNGEVFYADVEVHI